MRVKCLAQEHNAVPQPGLKPELLDVLCTKHLATSKQIIMLIFNYRQYQIGIAELHTSLSAMSSTSCLATVNS